jgi:hypothetical protein
MSAAEAFKSTNRDFNMFLKIVVDIIQDKGIRVRCSVTTARGSVWNWILEWSVRPRLKGKRNGAGDLRVEPHLPHDGSQDIASQQQRTGRCSLLPRYSWHRQIPVRRFDR